MKAAFGCLFERFPSFTQTFVAREAEALRGLGVGTAMYSVRSVSDEAIRHFPEALVSATTVLPKADEVAAEVMEMKRRDELPPHAVVTLRQWGARPDKNRVYEALWAGSRLHAAGVRHVHTHFAGIGARCCWWMRRFYGMSYSFTGHANDLFCPDEATPVGLGDLVRDAAVVVTVSDFTRDWLRERYPESAGRIERVYNGMAMPAEPPGWPREGVPVIVSVGRLIEKKGFGDLVRAAGLLRDRGVAFRCVIAGEGPLRGELERLIAESGLGGVVELAGARSQAEIGALLAGARVFALPCVVERDGGMDVLPTVLMEAMAAGLPCVATTVAGVPEMIEPGVTGALTGPGQPAAVAAALEVYLKDAGLAATHGMAGWRLGRERFDLAVTALELLRLLAGRGRVRLPAGLLLKRPELVRARVGFAVWRRWTAAVRVPRIGRDEAAFPEGA